MRPRWFRRFGWGYRPVSLEGWAIVVVLVALCVWVFVAVDRRSHSASDTLIGVLPYVAVFVGLAGWVAAHTSEERGEPGVGRN